MTVFEVILIMVELLLCVAVILVMLLLALLLHEMFRSSKPAPKGEGEQGSGCVQTIHPKSGT